MTDQQWKAGEDVIVGRTTILPIEAVTPKGFARVGGNLYRPTGEAVSSMERGYIRRATAERRREVALILSGEEASVRASKARHEIERFRLPNRWRGGSNYGVEPGEAGRWLAIADSLERCLAELRATDAMPEGAPPPERPDLRPLLTALVTDMGCGPDDADDAAVGGCYSNGHSGDMALTFGMIRALAKHVGVSVPAHDPDHRPEGT